MRYGETVRILTPDANHSLREERSSPALIAPVAEPDSPTVVSIGTAGGMTVYLPPETVPPKVGQWIQARGRRYQIQVEPQEWVGPDGMRCGTVITLTRKAVAQ